MARKKLTRRIFEGLPDQVRQDLRDKRSEFRGILQLKENQRMLAMRIADVERQLNLRPDEHIPERDPRYPDNVQTRLCTQADLETPWFTAW